MANPEWPTIILTNILLPILVAVLTYILVDRLGEWKRRKMYSRLGVAIIESLQEEVDNGIKLMTDALNAAQDSSTTAPPPALLPKEELEWNVNDTRRSIASNYRDIRKKSVQWLPATSVPNSLQKLF